MHRLDFFNDKSLSKISVFTRAKELFVQDLTTQDQRAGGLLLLRTEVQPSRLRARALQGDRRGPCHEGDDQEKEGGGSEEDHGRDEANDGEH